MSAGGRRRKGTGHCDRWCRDCRYYLGRHNAGRCCHYLLETGHMRPCQAGTGCTAKEARAAGGRAEGDGLPRHPMGASQ